MGDGNETWMCDALPFLSSWYNWLFNTSVVLSTPEVIEQRRPMTVKGKMLNSLPVNVKAR